jgi:HAD superfamily hydrolase (TIGR01509 family)
MTLRWIFWDNDGVLVDTEGLYRNAVYDVYQSFGFDFDEATYQHTRAAGMSSWQPAIDAGATHKVISQMKEIRSRLYHESIANARRAKGFFIPGVSKVLEALSKTYLMAIVTMATRHEVDISHMGGGMIRFMRFVLTVEDVNEYKPHPEPYLKALKVANANPDESLVVEDSEQGLKSAIAAGIPCIVVKNHYFGPVHDFTGAAAVLSSITELPGTIERLFSRSPYL